MSQSPFNIANSIFPGLNDKRGIMLCGYEWGFSKEDQEAISSGDEPKPDFNAQTTFANKSPTYGEMAFKWRYDNRIIKWFELFGHPLNRQGLGGDFEKCLLQTNWCDSQGHSIQGSYHAKLTDGKQVDNFLNHVAHFEPRLLMFFGSAMIDVLQAPEIKSSFEEICGAEGSPLKKIQKDFAGTRFKIGFQSFERCDLVSLPHPSSSRGLSDAYIALFASDIGSLIARVKAEKGLP